MSKLYVGEFITSKDYTRVFKANSIVVVDNSKTSTINEEIMPSVIYEKVAPNLGKEIFSKKVFPIVTKIGNKKVYENESMIDAASVIVEDKEWGLIEDEESLNNYIEDFISDSNYNQNVILLEKSHEYNQSIASGIIKKACALGTIVRANIGVQTMSHTANKYVKSIQK